MSWEEKRKNAPVAVRQTHPSKERVFEAVFEVMDLASWEQYISSGADISLKPNLGWDKLIPGAISAPWVVEGVILAIRDYVGKIYVIESDQVVCKANDAAKLTGIFGVCKRHNIPWVNMSLGDFDSVQYYEGLVLNNVKIPKILSRTELITLPLMKTHNKTTITGAIKNQWGCLEKLRHNFHPFLPKALVDVSRLTQPRFAIMDATIALEGNGPKSGIPKEMNMILASGNIVGIDATAASIMGFNPENISHLKLCAEYGFGSMTPVVLGSQIEDVQTEFLSAEHNLVSIAEILFRNSFFSQLIFHTFLFKFMTWFARRYYDIWDISVGRRIRKEISHSGYFNQFKAH